MTVDFSALTRQAKRSFGDQQATIKKVMQGKTVSCQTCGEALLLLPPEQHATPGIGCKKGCTFIQLDFA